MSEFRIKLTLDITGEHTKDADEELEELCNYISDRLLISGNRAVMQALAECIIELHDDEILDQAGLTMH